MRLLALLMFGITAAAAAAPESMDTLTAQVRDAENAFAKSMADRDLAAFASHVADDAVFFGNRDALRGKAAVVEAWKGFYEGPQAPFSWESADVQVLDSGKLAHSSGPVRDPAGKIVGSFNSIWRREANGQWKVVFDKGCNVCNCAEKPAEKPAS
jgi:ketosteroid isomerase-like protein